MPSTKRSRLFGPTVAVALADLRERSRSRTLVVVPILVAYFVKLVTVDTTLVLDGQYTGVLTSTWIAGMTTVIGTLVFFLFGFSFVKGAVTRDRERKVGELIAASSISTPQYLVGKWLSNVVVLAAATAILMAATGVAFFRQGTGGLDVWAFVSPFVLITLPTMGLVAAAAVCFEATGLLRGTAGTVVYFALALLLLSVSIGPNTALDVTGLSLVRESMAEAIAAQYPAFDPSALGVAYTDDPGSLQQFSWSGIEWSTSALRTRVPVVGLTVGLLGIATIAFDRFDDTGGWSVPFRGKSDDEATTTSVAEASHPPAVDAPAVDVSLPSVSHGRFAFGRVLLAELRLALRDHQWWWYLACGVGFIATGVAPLEVTRQIVVPLVLLVPLSVWSVLGAREQLHRTEELVFVGSQPLRLLSATYLSGVIVGLILTLPAGVRFTAAGLYSGLLGWGVGLLFLPAIALACGVWSGRSKLFEISYLTAWYLGPVNGLGYLDYLGVKDGTVTSGVTLGYLVVTVSALGVAVLGRRR
ncbi:ABC transporter permease [Halohasta salina]|uniref:ABC transporter permease n=1 Tax=Halohasta salina TaxID=2961621 RepID=UPI0020A53A13|nr:ABC transporter permease [Halohasta salina]